MRGRRSDLDQALALCRRAGFRKVTFRGDTDFSQTQHLDGWDAQGVRFVFGFDARANLIEVADSLPKRSLGAVGAPGEVRGRDRGARRRPENVKDIKVDPSREFENIRLRSEDVAEFAYSPRPARRPIGS